MTGSQRIELMHARQNRHAVYIFYIKADTIIRQGQTVGHEKKIFKEILHIRQIQHFHRLLYGVSSFGAALLFLMFSASSMVFLFDGASY